MLRRVFTGALWEKQVAYCRAIRSGDQIHISGTAPVAEGGGVHAPGDAYGQARRCFEIISKALGELGSGIRDVVRTRMYVTDITRWADYGRAHREFFAECPPATSMVEVKALIDPAMLIEVEAEAVCAR